MKNMKIYNLFTLSLSEFVSLRSSSDATSEMGEGNASLSVDNSLKISLGTFKVHSLDGSDNFEGILEVNSEISCRGLNSYRHNKTSKFHACLHHSYLNYGCIEHSLLTLSLDGRLARVNSFSHLCFLLCVRVLFSFFINQSRLQPCSSDFSLFLLTSIFHPFCFHIYLPSFLGLISTSLFFSFMSFCFISFKQ